MWRAMQDIHDLCVQDFTVLYLPRSRPVDGAYPTKCCQIHMDRSAFSSYKRHLSSFALTQVVYSKLSANSIYNLTSVEKWHTILATCNPISTTATSVSTGLSVKSGNRVVSHTQPELATKRCGTVTYCHPLVRPGYYPFYMNDPSLLAF